MNDDPNKNLAGPIVGYVLTALALVILLSV